MDKRIFNISVGESRKSTNWKLQPMSWAELSERCRQNQRTKETAREYAAMDSKLRGSIKDKGGFVAGEIKEVLESDGQRHRRRKNENILSRSMVTLDLDFVEGSAEKLWKTATEKLDYSFLVYSTHSHTEKTPRLRLVVPLKYDVDPEQYEPIARRIAEVIGMNQFDGTTYERARLMYWPTSPSDVEPFYRVNDCAKFLDPEDILQTYDDWSDPQEWPHLKGEEPRIRHEAKKQENPLKKTGIVGEFCRAYSIEETIEHFLSDVYKASDKKDRYTYIKGSMAEGLVCYDHVFAYSHHDSDPASRILCNAFDLVRLHRFGDRDRDKGSKADVTRLPSFKAMEEFANNDERVKVIRTKQLEDDFRTIDFEDEDEQWKKGLQYDKKGILLSTIENLALVLENDPQIKNRIRHDEFTGFTTVVGGLPWNEHAETWTDRDDSNLRAWFEKYYKIVKAKDAINDALNVVLTTHSFHPIKNYLESLKWDGTPRLERLIIDYLGADDTPLNRAMTRKHFTAAVNRVFEPGCKYDYCLILSGQEGCGKSTLLSKMGGDWFNDSIFTTEGKEGMDQLRKAWVIEMGELSSIKRSDVEQVKAYLSKTTDIYRAAYDRHTSERRRQCVFCGTTNEEHFLKGSTGNRRFWVVAVKPELRKYDVFKDLKEEVRGQLWAEAVHYYRNGEKLFLSKELEAEARQIQEKFNDDADDPLREQLRMFLDTKLPEGWNSKQDLYERRKWWADKDTIAAKGLIRRTDFTAAEFLQEKLGLDDTINTTEYKYKVRTINGYMRAFKDWKYVSHVGHVKDLYGRPSGFRRDLSSVYDDDDDL